MNYAFCECGRKQQWPDGTVATCQCGRVLEPQTRMEYQIHREEHEKYLKLKPGIHL